MNEVKLSGWLYQKKQINEKLSTFSIKYYAGKDKSGNIVNGFINCKYFGLLNAENKDKVEISGWLGFDNWEKDGKKQGRAVICCKEIVTGKETVQKTKEAYPDMDDIIPF